MITGKPRIVLSKIRRYLRNVGIDPIAAIAFLKTLPRYRRDLRKLKKQKGDNTDFVFGSPHPIYQGLSTKAGTLSGHYFHQDLFIAQRVYENNPTKHIDIGSRIDGFVAHVAVFREIEVFDIRPQDSKVENISFRQADLTDLPDSLVEYCDSVSSLHVIEHFGLGRYGDPIDYYGHLKAIKNIHAILKPGGTFYFSTPIGKQRIEFNAHRVFSVQYLLDLFKDMFELQHFSYVDDAGDLHKNVALEDEQIQRNYGCYFGCGIFELTKK